MIYIAHPFGGEQANIEKVQKIITGMLHKHPDHILLAATRNRVLLQPAYLLGRHGALF